jgi:hypothetical protein
MTIGELFKRLAPEHVEQAERFFKNFEAVMQPLSEKIQSLIPSPEAQKKLVVFLQAAHEASKDGSSMQSAVLYYAEHRLEELELPKDIWRQLTPEVYFGTVSFKATPEAERILGPRTESKTSGWTAWEAAQLACAANAALMAPDKVWAYALGFFIGETVREDAEKIKQLAVELSEQQRKANSQAGGRKKGAKSAPLYELLDRLKTRLNNPSPKEITKLFANSNNPTLLEAIALPTPLPIRIEKLDRENEILHYVVGEKRAQLSMSRVRRRLSRPATKPQRSV